VAEKEGVGRATNAYKDKNRDTKISRGRSDKGGSSPRTEVGCSRERMKGDQRGGMGAEPIRHWGAPRKGSRG